MIVFNLRLIIEKYPLYEFYIDSRRGYFMELNPLENFTHSNNFLKRFYIII